MSCHVILKEHAFGLPPLTPHTVAAGGICLSCRFSFTMPLISGRTSAIPSENQALALNLSPDSLSLQNRKIGVMITKDILG